MREDNNRTSTIVLGALVVLFVCVGAALIWRLVRPSGSTPTPVPTSTVPEGTAVPDDAWARVQAAGKIIVGTSTDYPPFEFYNANFQLEGFDIALMQAIGQQLGIQVEFRDMAFDGLGNALELNNIDAAIAAITVTSERDQFVDFSNTYYLSDDALLANSNSPINSIDNASQIVNQRVGVERGTVYDNWIETNLVETGQMPAGNVLAYENIQHAIRDLREGRIDLVALDLLPAQTAVNEGGVKIVVQGLNSQQMAIALANGQSALQIQINSALTTLINDGTVRSLIQQYMQFDDSNIVPIPTPNPTVPTPTPVPTATPQPCLDDMSFVADLNFDDQNMTAPPELPPGWPFVKGWRIRNSGTCPWDSTYRLVYVTGNSPAAQMGGQPTAVQGTVAAGQTYDMFVNLVAPAQPGTYQGFWQMVNGRNIPFGARVWVGIRVPAPATTTPVPTQTPAPNMQFSVNTTNINQGQCVQFTWNVTGATQVFFYRAGTPYQQGPAPATGSSQECPQSTTTFELRANWPNNTSEVRQLTINVTPAPQAPRIDRFTVEPGQIFTGGCVVLNWAVSGTVNQVDISRNGTPVWSQAPLNGQRQDCPPGTGGVAYNLVASGAGGTNQAQQNITIIQPTAVPPTATPIPPVPPPVINSFAVTPQQITAGDCVLISWSVGGGSVRTQVQRNGQVILDNAQHSGSLQDCLDSAGSYAYRLQTWNNNDQSTVADQTVTVTAAPTGPTLTNTNWNLVAYWNGTAETTPLPGTTSWILFNDNGTFSGNAGCNNYNGSYQLQGSSLTIPGPIVSTGTICGEPAGLMDQESQYLANLEAVRQFAINNNELQLVDGNGRVVLRYGVVTITPFGGQ